MRLIWLPLLVMTCLPREGCADDGFEGYQAPLGSILCLPYKILSRAVGPNLV